MKLTRNSTEATAKGVGAAAADPHTLVPLSSSYDLLAGAFNRAERTRNAFMALAVLTAIAVVVIGVLGYRAMSASSADRERNDLLTAQNAQVEAELAELDQAEGIDADTLRSHARVRHDAYLAVVERELGYAELLRTIAAGTPRGVDLTSITITEPAPAAAAGTADGTADGTAAAPVDPNAPRLLTVVGTATSFAYVGEWTKNLEKIQGLRDVTPVWSGGGESVVVTLTADVTDAARSARSIEAEGSDEYGIRTDTTATDTPAAPDADEASDTTATDTDAAEGDQ